jgi:hypothetical protein
MALLWRTPFSAILSVLLPICCLSAANALQPEALSRPSIKDPLYAGAEVVEVSRFTPNAEVRIYVDGIAASIGGGSCRHSTCYFDVQELKAGWKIRARQTVDGVTSHPTPDAYAPTVQYIPAEYLEKLERRLLPPQIASPLRACQRVVPVVNVVEGAFVQVFPYSTTNTQIGSTKTPSAYAPVVTDPLTEGIGIIATQQLYFDQPSDGFKRSIRSKPTQQEFELHKPEVDEGTLVVGSELVGVKNLWIGADVVIYYEKGQQRQVMHHGVAQSDSSLAPVDQPLSAAWAGCTECIKADQSLCEGGDKITVTGPGKPVRDFLDAPIIQEPICAGSIELTTCETVAPATLRIVRHVDGGPEEQIAQQGADNDCTAATLGVTLDKGNELFATLTVDKVYNRSKELVTVVDDMSQALVEIGNGTLCKPCQGQDPGPTFVRDMLANQTLTNKYGPVFKATMCNAEHAIVGIHGPDDALIATLSMEESKTRAGYFEAKLDWDQLKWSTLDHVQFGKYRAAFTIWPKGAGPAVEVDRYFYIATQGCLDCALVDFHRTCWARINKLRALENLPAVTRDEPHEACSDHDARRSHEEGVHQLLCHDGQSVGQYHQNWCPGFSSTDSILDDCVEQDMYHNEKKCYQRKDSEPTKACFSRSDYQSCECQWGHYHHMTDKEKEHTKAACGIYVRKDGKLEAVMNFWYVP